MATGTPADRSRQGSQRFATRLVAALAAAGLAIVIFGGIAYVQVISEIPDPATRSSVTAIFVGLVLTAAISLALVGVTVGSNTAITLRLLSSKARQMEQGNMDVELETDREDEIGDLADALRSMRDSLKERIETVERNQRETEQLNEHIRQKAAHYDEVLQRVMEGDLGERVDPESEVAALQDIGESINLTVSELEETTTEIAHQMDSLSATSEEVAASAEELVETSDRAATVGEQGRTAAESAMTEMNAVEAETEAAVEQMEHLNEEMDEISDIVRLISEIAQKTNILAVNARIESSRSERSSQGYSVVADEVRELAEETKEAAEEIERRIQRLEVQTDDTVGDIRETNDRLQNASETVKTAIESLEGVATLVDDVDANVKNISQATDEQARSVQAVASRVDRLTALEDQRGTAGALDEGDVDQVLEADDIDEILDVDSTTTDDGGFEFQDGAATEMRPTNTGE